MLHYMDNSYSSRQSNYAEEAPAVSGGENVQPFYTEELVFRILCHVDKIVKVFGESEGIVDLLQNEIGIDVRVSEPVAGSDEHIIVISSEEAPDDQIFPSQETLLHIQTRIVDLVPGKDNLITTRLIVSSRDSVCLEGKAGSVSEISRVTGANVQILAREETPRSDDVVVQITGEIRSTRDALVELTLRLRSLCARRTLRRRHHRLPHPQLALLKVLQESLRKLVDQLQRRVKMNSGMRFLTREADKVIPKLVTKSRNKLAQISEWSGASVTLV